MCPKETALCELYENAKCKVPNNMIEICVTDSKNYVMCSGRGSLEEQWWIGDKHQLTRWGERLWTPKMKRNKVTQKMSGWVCTMALNAKSGKCDSECHTETKARTSNWPNRKNEWPIYMGVVLTQTKHKLIGKWPIDMGAAPTQTNTTNDRSI